MLVNYLEDKVKLQEWELAVFLMCFRMRMQATLPCGGYLGLKSGSG
jgi:hypothetical protein